jgi:hypothetical protein
LRGNVLIKCCFSPVSPIALRAAFRRVVSAASETMRPFQTALMRSSLLTTRSLFRIRYSSSLSPTSLEGCFYTAKTQLGPHVGLRERAQRRSQPYAGLPVASTYRICRVAASCFVRLRMQRFRNWRAKALRSAKSVHSRRGFQAS